MRCSGCGQPLESGTAICLRCGTPVPRDRVAVGTILEEHTHDDSWADAVNPTSPYGPFAITQPPPPPFYAPGSYVTDYPKPKTWPDRMRGLIAAGLALLMLSSVGFGLYSLARLRAINKASSSVSTGNIGTAMLPGTRCSLLVKDATAAANLTDVQLTSGLRDPSRGDFSPVDSATVYEVGQTIYSTFTVATNADATISAEWCWGKDGQLATYTMQVANDLNVGGYFELSNIDHQDVGQGVVTIRWNSLPAAVLIFTVQPVATATPAANS